MLRVRAMTPADALFELHEIATSHVGPETPGPDPETGTPALEGLWADPVRYGPSTIVKPDVR